MAEQLAQTSSNCSSWQIPSHVPPELVFDFDIGPDPDPTREPHAKALELHEQAPEIFYSPRYGGQWMVRSLDAAREVTQSADRFKSGDTDEGLINIPINLDPPEHDFFRPILAAAFAPKEVRRLTGMITKLADDLIGEVADKGSCEFMEIATRLPVWVFMKFAGFPLDQFDYLRGLTVKFLREPDVQKRTPMYQEVMEATGKIIRAREAEPQDDMISHLIHTDFGGRRITFDEMQSMCVFFVHAGLDTVTSALGFGFHYLATHPDLQSQLRADPESLDIAAEELLRIGAPSSVARHVACDMEFRGVRFKQGDKVHILYPAANIDPNKFPEPRSVDLRRQEPTVAFGTGPHRCLGSHLARLEMRILYDMWLRRIPEFRLDPERPVTYHTGLVWGVEKLWLKWDDA